MKKLLALSVTLAALLLSACEKEQTVPSLPESSDSQETVAADFKHYTYREAVALLSDNWNPHTCETEDQDYPNQFLGSGLYRLYFNDSVHPLEGKQPFESYVMEPELATAMPEDITKEIQSAYPVFGIPEGKTQGYAFRIPLNPKAAWENGKQINAHTYVESMLRLLDPALQNPRAADMYFGEFCLAGAENYVNQGSTAAYNLPELGQRMKGSSFEALMEAYGAGDGLINWQQSFGAMYDFVNYPWAPGQAVDPEGFCLPAEDSLYYSGLTLQDLLEFEQAVKRKEGLTEEQALSWAAAHSYGEYTYPQQVNQNQLGLFAEDDYTLVLVLEKQISLFTLCDFLTDSWLVEPNLYDACIQETENGYVSCYGTSLDTTLSCGPYRMTGFQPGHSMTFERNNRWFGYGDPKHCYQNPQTGKARELYETDVIETLVMETAQEQKDLFLKGGLSVYGMQPEDYTGFRSSPYCYADPSDVTLNLIIQGNLQALSRREQGPKFDENTFDLQTMTLLPFRKAISQSIDREIFTARINPSCRGGYGLIGDTYLSDRETGTRYREEEQARKVICSLYGVNPEDFGGDLLKAAGSVTGYDPEGAKENLNLAFSQALELGYVTDQDSDGLSDQTVTMELCVNLESPMKRAIVDFLNEELSAAARETPFAGKIRFTLSKPYGNRWYEIFAEGESDLVLAGWTGNSLNPYSLTELYTDGVNQYDGAWFHADLIPMTLNLKTAGGQRELTLSLRQWSQALNGSNVRDAGGFLWNFGETAADQEQRLTILAAIEQRILKQYHYIPLMQSADIHLLSIQAEYPTEHFHPVMGRGGLAYLGYRYTDQEWLAYVQEQKEMLEY